MAIIDCISDLHGHFPELEGGDLLIVAGDLTGKDTTSEQLEFISWIQSQKYKKKIFIAGNHDNWLPIVKNYNLEFWGVTYLCDSGTEFYSSPVVTEISNNKLSLNPVEKYKIWGSPWTLRFPGMNPHCMAFTVDTEEELAEKWALIPEDTDILVTHSPPSGILDRTVRNHHIGSSSLNMHVICSSIKVHIFGHIHESYGIKDGSHLQEYDLISVNASHINERYEPVNKPIRITL